MGARVLWRLHIDLHRCGDGGGTSGLQCRSEQTEDNGAKLKDDAEVSMKAVERMEEGRETKWLGWSTMTGCGRR
jgi:hypothetical protein